jgi:hypothetical protein
MTIAVAMGMRREEIDQFFVKFDSCLKDFKKKLK